jgi:threonine dehydratase
MPEAADLDAAWEVVSSQLAPTPLDTGPEPWLKLESLQPAGSFKIRGALAALTNVTSDVPVVTASAGNHGIGVAYAARLLGRRATVVVPGNASEAKVATLRELGAEVVQVGSSYDDAEAHVLELAAAGAYYVSAYNDPAVIAGQGTIGRELDTQLTGPMTVVCGVGGGGLASGLGLWASTRSDVRVVGVEAAVSTAVSASIKAGGDVTVPVGETLADGMAGNLEPGSITVELIKRHVHAMVTVTEPEIHAAIRYLARQRGIVAEGAGAAPVAALLAGKIDVHGHPVAVVSGRNITLPTLAGVLQMGHSGGA